MVDGRHISCKNHNLALAGKVMLEEDGELKNLMTKIFACGAHVRNSCKVSTGLRNKAASVDPQLANVSAKSESTTRQWLGAAITMQQHIKIQPFLVELSKERVGKMRDHQESLELSFMDKVGEHSKYMRNIRGCSVSLQKPGLPLKDCQMMLDQLIRKVKSDCASCKGMLAKCKLRLNYLYPMNSLSTDADFEMGIVKIQSGIEQNMTPREKLACQDFLLNASTGMGYESESSVDSNDESFFQCHRPWLIGGKHPSLKVAIR